jgi:hypothetical protein
LINFCEIRLLDAFFYLIETGGEIPEPLITPGTDISA